MTIVGEGQPRSPGRTATVIQNLSPGYFPFVMATSIISTGTFLLEPLSRFMLWVALAAWVAVAAAPVAPIRGAGRVPDSPAR